jgi:hypothetical protein
MYGFFSETGLNCLSGSISPVDDYISTSGVGRSVTCKVYIGSFELGCFPITTQRYHTVPKVLGLLRNEIRQPSIDISRRNTVNAGKVSPLIGKRSSKMNTSGFSYVIAGLNPKLASSSGCNRTRDTYLFLRIVRNMAGH